MRKIKKVYLELVEQTGNWSRNKFFQLTLFNLILLSLFLLRSAGYFHPYFSISVNFIVMVGLILAAVLLGAKSRVMFGAALAFWLFASVLKLLKIDVWADRTGIYVYEAMVVGVVLLVFEKYNFGKLLSKR